MPRTVAREHSSDTRKTRDHVWVLAASLLPPQNTLVKAICGPVLNNKHD